MSDIIKQNTVSAEKQLKGNESLFYLGNPDAKTRIVIVGNSITRHGIKEDIGWDRLCGMAASDEEHDYVHILYRKLTEVGQEVYMMVNQLSDWEMHHRENILGNYTDIRDFKPDWFVFRLGENIHGDRYDETLPAHMEKMLAFFTTPKTKVVMTTCFWKNADVDEAIRSVAKKGNHILVEMGDLGDREDMRAGGLFWHGGVASHPGDKGMAHIAQRIFDVMV